MKTLMALLVACAPLAAQAAAPPPEGRWTGEIRIPSLTQNVVVDLAQDRSGTWSGSVILPGRGVKGAPLHDIAVTPGTLEFDLADVLRDSDGATARFRMRRIGPARLAGTFSQGGHSAPVEMRRVAAGHVEPPLRSTPVGREYAATWSGAYMRNGQPRHVTITIVNHEGRGATAEFVIAGSETRSLPVDLVIADGPFVRIESKATHVTFEGRYQSDADELRGNLEAGPIEIPLVMRRTTGSGS